MWSTITLVMATIFDWCGQVFSLYTQYDVFAYVLILWIVRRVLKTFNLI